METAQFPDGSRKDDIWGGYIRQYYNKLTSVWNTVKIPGNSG